MSELRPSKRSSARHARSDDLLQRVLGVVHRAEHPVAVRVELAAVGLEQPREGLFVTGAGGVEERGFHGRCTLVTDEFARPGPGLRCR